MLDADGLRICDGLSLLDYLLSEECCSLVLDELPPWTGQPWSLHVLEDLRWCPTCVFDPRFTA